MLGILVVVLLAAGCLTQSISIGMTAENNTSKDKYVWIGLRDANNESIGSYDFLLQPNERKEANMNLDTNTASVLIEANSSTKRLNFTGCSPKQIDVTITPPEKIHATTNCNKS
ncbi:hypothetical protein ZOD2009_05917 [Haladaptatus paucihalophilus DX253]|uniref:Lipoprotein n=1 Tax=Haladaptatus paucihalophilus DX253 TaxID=797209 RepID=E7QQW3_HALPU|nr:hypothetical protein ZOD2009_05917 [Haladaptatus paucihalophilus DX253]SHK52966.1 hypothetical protein SAMN05444342_1567 [Haladaptatus paucihalophilus DX253]